MNLRNTLQIKNGILEIGGLKTTELAKKYKTPVYVMDVSHMRSLIRAFKNTLNNAYGDADMAYASKAFSCSAMYHILKQENTFIDVVTGGEIFTAINAGFDMRKAFFHGNNKLEDEIILALDNNLGYFAIDSIQEIELLNRLCSERGIIQDVSVRVNPGVEAHTHSYIQTAKIDSKFGFSISNGDATRAIDTLLKCKNLCLVGLNCHIGSQIFEKNAFRLAVDIMTDYIVYLKDNLAIEIDILNLGGGFGVHYTNADPKYTIDDYCSYILTITEVLNLAISNKNIKKPKLILEPGRAIVAEAGITLYSVGNIKTIPNVKKYVSIDGGMFDNIRPALYQAEYEAIIANRADEKPIETVAITGKCCESADIMINKIDLPKAIRGDLIAVFSTGAYNYSMASNYNRNMVPPVVFVENGKSDYAVRPQSYQDLLRNDNIPEFLKK